MHNLAQIFYIDYIYIYILAICCIILNKIGFLQNSPKIDELYVNIYCQLILTHTWSEFYRFVLLLLLLFWDGDVTVSAKKNTANIEMY